MNFHPLDDEIGENLGFDCCRVLKMDVAWAEFYVPLSDSSGSFRVVEDVCEWRTADYCYRVLVKIVRYFARGHEDGVDKLLIMRVSLLGAREDFTEVVDWPLDAMGFAFFGTLDDEDGADNVALSGDVKV